MIDAILITYLTGQNLDEVEVYIAILYGTCRLDLMQKHLWYKNGTAK